MSTHLKSLTRRTNPGVIPVFPLSGTVLLPGCELPLNIFEPRYLNMVDDALKGDRLIGMVQSTPDGMESVGGLGRITQFSETDDGRYLIVLKGLKRFRIMAPHVSPTPYRQASVDFDEFQSDADAHVAAGLPEAMSDIGGNDRTALTLAMKTFARAIGVKVDWDALSQVPLPSLVDQAAMISPFKPSDKQSLLEAPTTEDRRRCLISLMHLYARPNSGEDGSSPAQKPVSPKKKDGKKAGKDIGKNDKSS